MRKFLPTLIICISLSLFLSCFGLGVGTFSVDKKIALIEIKGIIIEPDQVVWQFEKARKDSNVKAVVVRVDSPGGSVGASQEIFRTIQNLDKEKPVIISMGDVAASGGYYVSIGGRKIFANDGTITGSIGVRMEHVNAAGLYDLIRIKPETLKSGKFKGLGSTYKTLSPEDRELLQNFLVELHDQFKNDIVSARGIDRAEIDVIADGRIFSGLKAKELGLIDEIGGMLEAVKEAAIEAGIKGEPKIVKMKKKRSWVYDFLSDKASMIFGQARRQLSNYKYFSYEWKPYDL